MLIKSISLTNYKQFYRAEMLEFCPGVNIIQGNGQTGKTTVLHLLNCLLSVSPVKDYYAHGIMRESFNWSAERKHNQRKKDSIIYAVIEVTSSDLDKVAYVNRHISKLPDKGKSGLKVFNLEPGDSFIYKIVNGKEVIERKGKAYIQYLKHYYQLRETNKNLKPLVKCFPEGRTVDLEKCKGYDVVLIDNLFGSLSSEKQEQYLDEVLKYQDLYKTQFIITIMDGHSQVINRETNSDANWVFLKDYLRMHLHLT